MKKIKIKLGLGFDNILFGMPKDIVEEKLGTPDSIHINNYKQDDQYERWEYSELNTNLYFVKEEGYILEGIETENTLFLLNDHQVIGMGLTDFEKLIPALNLQDLEKDEEMECFNSDSHYINIWYEEEIITSIQWGYLFDSEDEPIIPYENKKL